MSEEVKKREKSLRDLVKMIHKQEDEKLAKLRSHKPNFNKVPDFCHFFKITQQLGPKELEILKKNGYTVYVTHFYFLVKVKLVDYKEMERSDIWRIDGLEFKITRAIIHSNRFETFSKL